jgi:hypothetical protein
VSAGCSGVNYTLRLRERSIEAKPRSFSGAIMTIEMASIKSVELRRKSVMPPAVIGAVCLALGVILGIAEEELVAVLPVGFRIPLQFLAIGAAVVCLAILLSRWFFGNLILTRVDASPITVRMVPTASARRFVMLIQTETLGAEAT